VWNLTELNVSNNDISRLSQDVFANNPELVRLDVSNNHIVTIHRDAFRKNPKIREIYAGSNGLIYLHPGIFSGNPQLTKVTVSWNKIQDINPQTFYSNPNLEYLDFNNNRLKALDPGTFQKNPMLKSVDLSSNSLVTIHDNTFHFNPKLERLFLSRNQHIRLHGGLIILASSLKVFDAQHCNLSSLPADFFKNSTALRQLLLGNNNLTSLDCVSNEYDNSYVDTLTKLQVIDVSNNQLQTINVEVLRNKMTDLKSLRIEGNPFLCDCKLQDAWLWSQKVGIIPPQPQITCTDVQWRPVPWDDVQHLNCSDESLTEEPTSAVTETHTEESTSTVTDWYAEKSASSGRSTPAKESTSTTQSTNITNISTVPQHFNSSHESLAKQSATGNITAYSAVTDTNIDVNILRVEEQDDSTHEDKERNYKILIVLLFAALGVVLVVFLLVFLMRRRHGTYKVSKNASGMKNNNLPSGVEVNAAPAL
jgi:Leucine-rich repeat (LRR) protein